MAINFPAGLRHAGVEKRGKDTEVEKHGEAALSTNRGLPMIRASFPNVAARCACTPGTRHTDAVHSLRNALRTSVFLGRTPNIFVRTMLPDGSNDGAYNSGSMLRVFSHTSMRHASARNHRFKWTVGCTKQVGQHGSRTTTGGWCRQLAAISRGAGAPSLSARVGRARVDRGISAFHVFHGAGGPPPRQPVNGNSSAVASRPSSAQ